MKFLATGTAIDGLALPPDQVLGAYRATFEIFAAGKEPRIKEVYPHADERATTLLIEADSAEELADTIGHLPGYLLCSWQVHPVASVQHTLRGITEMQSAFAS
jgi:hypothetical protein